MGCKTSSVKEGGPSAHAHPQLSAGSVSSAQASAPTRKESADEKKRNAPARVDTSGSAGTSAGLSASRRNSGEQQGRKGSALSTNSVSSAGNGRAQDTPVGSGTPSNADGHVFHRPLALHSDRGGRAGAADECGVAASGDDDSASDAPRSHFDPIPAPPAASASPPSAPVASRREAVSPEPIHHTSLEEHQKTDAAQAAEEYQKRVQAKKEAEDAKAAQQQIELFDPIRPLDSFNVTHRALLGRCWDRRVPELVPISFVHSALATEASNMFEQVTEGSPRSTAGRAVDGKDVSDSAGSPVTTDPASSLVASPLFPPQHYPPQKRQQLHDGSVAPVASSFCGADGPGSPSAPPMSTVAGAGSVPRRSHWFSVCGYNSHFSTPTTLSHPMGLLHAVTAGALSMDGAGSPTRQGARPAIQGSTPAALASAASAASIQALREKYPTMPTVSQITQMSIADRVDLANMLMACNPRYYGLKATYAFRLSEEDASNPGAGEPDPSTAFLRKRGLSPAYGVKVVRWNHIEYFNPSFKTLVKAVAKTQGIAHLARDMLAAGSRQSSPGAPPQRSTSAVSVSAATPAGVVPVESAVRVPPRGDEGRGGSCLSLDSNGYEDAEGGLALTAQRPARNVTNLSFIGQHLIASGENLSFAWAGNNNNNSNSNNHSSNLTHNVPSSSGGGAHAGAHAGSPGTTGGVSNNSFLHRSLVGAPHRHRVSSGSRWGTAAHTGSLAEGCRFPEDSVLSLAMEAPATRLAMLDGVPPAMRLLRSVGADGEVNISVGSGLGLSGASSGRSGTPSILRFSSRDDVRSARRSNSGLNTAASPQDGSKAAAPAVPLAPQLIALSVSSFSISIDPFHWEENHYTRAPVDVDAYKRSARRDFGEGIITDVMYGGVLVIECSSAEAGRHLLGLLRAMRWSEGRSLAAIIGDVKKRFQALRTQTAAKRKHRHHKGGKEPDGADAASAAAAKSSVGRESEVGDAAGAVDRYQYRISRRIGGRSMRDAVELKQISVFLGATVVEQAQTLSVPSAAAGSSADTVKAASPHTQRAALALEAVPSSPATSASPVSSPTSDQFDPDVTAAFSRVASAWVDMQTITAVMRAWASHLLCNEEYAQPVSFFLQRFSGVAPVLQHSTLSSLFHQGGTPTDDSGDDAEEEELQFFEPSAHSPVGGANKPSTPPIRSISRFNRFYAPQPGSVANSPAEHPLPKSASGETLANGDDPRHHFGLHSDEDADGDAEHHHRHDGLPHANANHLTREPSNASAGDAAATAQPSVLNSQNNSFQPPPVREAPAAARAQRTVDGGAQASKSSTAPPTPLEVGGGARSSAASHGAEVVVSPGSASSTDPGDTAGDSRHLTFIYADPTASYRSSEPQDHDSKRSCPVHGANAVTPAGAPVARQVTARANDNTLVACTCDSSFLQTPPGPPTPVRARTRKATTVYPGETSLYSNNSVEPPQPSQSMLANAPERLPTALPHSPTGEAPPLGRPQGPAADPPPAREETAKGSADKTPAGPKKVKKKKKVMVKKKKQQQKKKGEADSPSTAVAANAASAPAEKAPAKDAKTAPGGGGGGASSSSVSSPTLLTGSSPTSLLPLLEREETAASPSSLAVTTARGKGGAGGEGVLPPAVRGAELEEMWHIADLELKAQQQELAEVRSTKLVAEERHSLLLGHLQTLQKAFLPHMATQELDLTFLYLKTALFEVEDLPGARVFANHEDWLPILIALWTSPANSVQQVEIPYPLTSRDLPKLGILTGLMYHKFSTRQLQRLEINASLLMGKPTFSAASPLNDGTSARSPAGAAAGERQKKKKKKGSLLAKLAAHRSQGEASSTHRSKGRASSAGRGAKGNDDVDDDDDEEDGENDDDDDDSEPLVFYSPNAKVRTSHGAPGVSSYAPPYYVSPVQARDVLWLMLCALAENTTSPDVCLCLRGFPSQLPAKDLDKLRREESIQNARSLEALNGMRQTSSIASFFAKRRAKHIDLPTNSFQLSNQSLNLDSFVVASLSAEGSGNTQATGSGHNPSFTHAVTYGELSEATYPQASIVVTDDDASVEGTVGEMVVVAPSSGVGQVVVHPHRSDTESWMRGEARALVQPFFTILFHTCPDLTPAAVDEQQRRLLQEIKEGLDTGGQAGALSALSSGYSVSPPVTHYHHDYNASHNNPNFYIPPARQRKLASLAMQASGGPAPTRSSPDTNPLADGAAQKAGPTRTPSPPSANSSLTAVGSCVALRDAGGHAGTESWAMSPAAVSLRSVFGLSSAAEEASVLEREDATLFQHADEIWSVLRRATHNYNKQTERLPASPAQPHSPKGSVAVKSSASTFGGAGASEDSSGGHRRAIILER